MRRPTSPGPLFVLAAATLWGSAGTAQELGPSAAWPPAVAALRSLGGGVLLLGFVAATRGGAALVGSARRAPRPLLAAGAAIAGFQWAYFSGIRSAGVAVGTLLAIGSAPVWAGLLEALAGRRPGPRWMFATAVTLVGTALLVLAGGDTSQPVDVTGVAWALGAGAAYALYTVASKRMVDRHVRGATAMALTFVISAALLLPALVPHDLAWVTTTSGLTMLGWLAVATIAVAYTLFAAGLVTIDAPTATTLTLAEPLTATVLAVLVVGERLPAAAAVGAALVGAGLAMAGRRSGRLRSVPVARGSDGRDR